MTLEELVDEFESKTTSHPSINTFIFEDLEAINELHSTDYPLVLLRPTEDTIQPRKNEQDYNIEMYMLDVYHQDDAKTLRKKYSDMQDWGIQVIQDLYEVSEIKNVGDITVDRGQDRYNDNLVVLQYNFTIRVHECMGDLVKPANLAAVAASSSQIDLTWTDYDTTETNYEVYRSLDFGTWTLVNTIAADSNSYSDTGLDSSTLYFYKVRAITSTNYSQFSKFSYAVTTA